ncbi:MAG TPA: transcriptional repressor [Dehalococcoidia bacterium]|nr:transcriptional repressor [Dehalococcoidia bacterium]
MSCETETAAALRNSGQKVTPQRMLVLCAVRHRPHHVTAGEVLEDVKRAYPYIDISTVYRTLNAARDLRLVNELYRAGGDTEYEWVGGDRHHHLICRSCGSETRLDDSYLESISMALLADHGFEADLDHFAITGLCARCRAAAEGVSA